MASLSHIRLMGLNGVYNQVDEFMAGQVVYMAGGVIPTGYLECNGATVSRSTYGTLFAAIGSIYGPGDGATTFHLPDLRGEFLRGADKGRGVDSGRAIGSGQAHLIGSHAHEVNYTDRDSAKFASAGDGTFGAGDQVKALAMWTAEGFQNRWGRASGSNIGTETRPRNIAMVACIKY